LAIPSPGSTLLVRLPNPLGDVVMATSLLRELRKQATGVRILACGSAPFGPLLEGLDSLDGFLPLPPKGRGYVGRAAAVMREAGADTSLLLPNSWSTALAAWRAGIPLRVGRRAGGRSLLLQRSLPPIPGPAPMTELYADFLPALDLQRVVPPAELVAGPPRTVLPTDTPLATGTVLPTNTPLLAVAPGAAFGVSKKLPVETLVATIDAWFEESGWRPLLLGSPAERPELEALAAQLKAPALLADPAHLGLDEAKALLNSSHALLAMDNGARHMAAALGVPQVVVYGPTHPAWSAHALEHTTLIRREELDCLSCHHKLCPLPDHPCMQRITVEQLLAALRALPQQKNGDR